MFQALVKRLQKKFAPRIYQVGNLRGASQSNESEIILEFFAAEKAPPTFIEFGFHPSEFNCISLCGTCEGLLIDGDKNNIEIACFLLPKNVEAVHQFLTLDNLDLIRTKFERLGVLSIDVDGNDYWFLESLIATAPSIICVEYNATFGLRSLSVPYAADFDRHDKHPSGWYHGASLPALAKLCARHGYGLAAVSQSGVNAFFTRNGPLNPQSAWRENMFRKKWSNTSVTEQWKTIRSMPYIEIG